MQPVNLSISIQFALYICQFWNLFLLNRLLLLCFLRPQRSTLTYRPTSPTCGALIRMEPGKIFQIPTFRGENLVEFGLQFNQGQRSNRQNVNSQRPHTVDIQDKQHSHWHEINQLNLA